MSLVVVSFRSEEYDGSEGVIHRVVEPGNGVAAERWLRIEHDYSPATKIVSEGNSVGTSLVQEVLDWVPRSRNERRPLMPASEESLLSGRDPFEALSSS